MANMGRYEPFLVQHKAYRPARTFVYLFIYYSYLYTTHSSPCSTSQGGLQGLYMPLNEVKAEANSSRMACTTL